MDKQVDIYLALNLDKFQCFAFVFACDLLHDLIIDSSAYLTDLTRTSINPGTP